MINRNISNLTYALLTLFLFGGCASYLSVTVIDSDSGVPVENITVEATADGMPTAQKVQTLAGKAEFKNIKKSPVKIVIPKSDDYFSKTLTLDQGADIKNVEIRLDSLQTILYGKVLDPLGRGIKGCLIRTEPTTDTLRTDIDGLYTLRSKQFVAMYYDVIAMHENYRMNRKSNIFIQPDQEHWIQPIKLTALKGFNADTLGPVIENLNIGDDAVRLDDF